MTEAKKDEAVEAKEEQPKQNEAEAVKQDAPANDEPQEEKKKEDIFTCIKKYGFVPTMRTRLRATVIELRRLYLVKVWGMDIHPDTLISLQVNLDRTYPKGIHVGEGTAISFGAVILTHDYIRGVHVDTHIGKYCQVGARSIVMPGLTIGDHSVIGAGTVVTKDVPPNSLVVGNPGKIIRTEIMTEHWGKITDKGNAAPKK